MANKQYQPKEEIESTAVSPSEQRQYTPQRGNAARQEEMLHTHQAENS